VLLITLRRIHVALQMRLPTFHLSRVLMMRLPWSHVSLSTSPRCCLLIEEQDPHCRSDLQVACVDAHKSAYMLCKSLLAFCLHSHFQYLMVYVQSCGMLLPVVPSNHWYVMVLRL